MEKIIKYATVIRNNWKKSTLGAFAIYYGLSTAKEKYEIDLLMRVACKEAAKYGDTLIPMDRNPTLVTVILNPVANKRKAKQEFEKYCEPLLHLAGLQLDVIQTSSEGNAKEIVESLKGTEAIIVAGGDGTLSETVTGLLRRTDGANQFPIGVLPLGRTNTLGNTLFPGGKGVEKAKQLILASMAIIKGNTTWKDAMKIEPIQEQEDEDEKPSRPIYALTSLEWGAFRDTMSKRDKYWFVGPFRDYATFIFNGYKNNLNWDCKGVVEYSPPCQGCNNCIIKQPAIKKRWSFFMPTAQAIDEVVDIVNPECTKINELCFKTCDFKIRTPNVEKFSDVPSLVISLGKPQYSYTDFVTDGWKMLKGERLLANVIPARTVLLKPQVEQENQVIEIDKEEFDVKTVKVTILPRIVKFYYDPDVV